MDWSGFGGTYGCLWVFFKGTALVYAIISIALGEGSAHTWGILIVAVIYVLLKILYHRATKRDYNRKDSYWSQKDEPDETQKE